MSACVINAVQQIVDQSNVGAFGIANAALTIAQANKIAAKVAAIQ